MREASRPPVESSIRPSNTLGTSAFFG